MADKVISRGKATSSPGGIRTSGQSSLMKGPVYRDQDALPKYRGGSSNPNPGKKTVVG
jgi:hypothetical protein